MLKKQLDQPMMEEIKNVAAPFHAYGKVAEYIPELSLMPPDLFSLSCIVSGTNHVLQTGDTDVMFTMQSISKILSLAYAIEKFGAEKVFKYVNMEPSADSFNSLMRLEMASPIPTNPFMNAGAIVVCSILKNELGTKAFEEIVNFCDSFTGSSPNLNKKVFDSEFLTADRNKSLAYFLNSTGLLMDSVENSLELYIKLCSLECTTLDLARIADVLSCGGMSVFTGQRPLSLRTVNTVVGIMTTCGFYNGSGEFAVRVGIPGKSGISGGILALAPGKMGVGVFSPSLDPKGNSIAGLSALESLSDRLNLRGTKILT